MPWAAHCSGEQDTFAGSLRCAQEKQCMPRGTLGHVPVPRLTLSGKAQPSGKKNPSKSLPPHFYNFQRHSVNGMWASKPLGKHTQASASLPAPAAELHPQGPSSPWRQTQGASISCCPTHHLGSAGSQTERSPKVTWLKPLLLHATTPYSLCFPLSITTPGWRKPSVSRAIPCTAGTLHHGC